MPQAPEIPLCPEPDCKQPLQQRVRYGKEGKYGQVYFVDLACLFCTYRLIDTEGGV